jgi:guanylate kinase
MSNSSNNPATKGLFFVLVGPAGAGKSSVASYLVEKFSPNAKLAISATSRDPRPGEVEGMHYLFTSREQFKKDIEAGRFFEWEETHGNYYGTPQEQIDYVKNSGGITVLDIDIRGAEVFYQSFPADTYLLLLLPPSVADLINRMEKRGGLTEDDLKRRLNTTLREFDSFTRLITTGLIKSVIINNSLENTRNAAAMTLGNQITLKNSGTSMESKDIISTDAAIKAVSDLKEQIYQHISSFSV